MHNAQRWGATPEEWQYWSYVAGVDLLPAVADPHLTANAPRNPKLRHLDSLAKTPSWIDSTGKIAGVSAWTAHRATPDMVRAWAANPAYNILLLTRNVRAIDIDVADSATADAIEHAIVSRLGVPVPVRFRADSGKRTLLLRTNPHVPIRKRVIRTPAGAVEFLADGQQTALCGTHPSGARFQLRGPHSGPPVVDLGLLATVWDELRALHDPDSKPLIVPAEQQAEAIVRRGTTLRNDPVLQYLEAEGWVTGYEADGIANVRCPWEHDHTPDQYGNRSGSPSSTSWLPAGLGGQATGGFRCLHAHCEGRHTGVFLEKIGYNVAQANEIFGAAAGAAPAPLSPRAQLASMLGAPEATHGSAPDIGAFHGVPRPSGSHAGAAVPGVLPWDTVAPAGGTLGTGQCSAPVLPGAPHTAAPAAPPVPLNPGRSVTVHRGAAQRALSLVEEAEREALVAAALREAGRLMERDDKTGKPLKKQCNLLVALSTQPQAISVRRDNFRQVTEVSIMGGAWQPLTDPLVTRIRVMIERAIGHTFERTDISHMLDQVGESNQYDSAQDAVQALVWDGKDRITDFDSRVLKMHSCQYSRAVAAYLWVAMAGRVLHPGVKADIMPILISPNQSTGKSSFVEALALHPEWHGLIALDDKDDNTVRMIQGKVAVEIPELRGLSGRDASSTKAFLTTQEDQWVPKFRERAVEAPRRCLFIGTDNKTRMLSDPTGNRRYAPLRVAVTSEFIDWPGMQQEIEQYWAQACAMIAQFPSVEAAVEHYSTAVRNLAGPFIAAATVLDAWHAPVERFVVRQAPGALMSLEAVFRDALGGGLLSLDNFKAHRIRGIMTVMGFVETSPDVWRVPHRNEFIL